MKNLLTLALSFTLVFANAQSYLSFYNFNHVNQNLMVNPASPHNYKFVIGIPGIGGFNSHVNSGSFNLDGLETGEDINSKLNDAISGLKPNDRINLNETVDGIFVGFETKIGYFTVAAQQITDFNMIIPSELMKFLYFGNVGSGYLGKTLTMDNFNIEVNARNEYSIGFQRKINDKIILGGRYKYISGIANTYVEKFKFDLYTDVDIWSVETDIMMNTSGSAIVDNADIQGLATNNLFSSNTGMGFDIGAYYKINDKFDVSVSALNLGWVKWKKDLTGIKSQGSFDFEGLDLNYPGDDFNAGIDNLLDSIGNAFNFEDVAIDAYTTPLPSHFIVSGQFYATEKHVFGLLYQGSLWNKNLYHNYGIMYNGRYAKWINIMAGYSIQNNVLHNVSLGLSLRFGFFQIYALTDNTFGILNPTSVNSVNLRAGITLSFLTKPKILQTED